MENPQIKPSTIPLPDAFPWGVAVLAAEDGTVLQANAHLQQNYLESQSENLPLEEQFAFAEKSPLRGVLQQVRSGKGWSGRVTPLKNRHGISSIEVMIHQSQTDPDQLWLYTLEHPSVNGAVRVSSRSELKLLQILLDNTLEHVFFRDGSGRFILTNSSFDRDVGAVDGSPIGQRIGRFISDESAEWVAGIDERVLSSGQPSVNNVAEFTFKNGTKHWLQMSTVPVRNNSGVMVGTLCVARDISDLKRTESELRNAIADAKAASRAKGEFLAAMSHEIRTPINGVIGASELCQETELDDEQRGYIDTVIQCGNTLLTLVNDVLDFSKIEAGQLNLEQLNFDPETLLEEIVEEFAQMVRKKGIELILSCDENMPRHLMGDPTRLKQIFYNLVGNAVKFTEEGEIILKAELVERSKSLATIRFSVVDTGVGIAEFRRDAIFNSFTQEDMSTTRKYGGTGLGLAICKELTELMAGTLDVESEVGKGSTFTLEVPFELSANPGIEAIPFSAELIDLKVLVVDDSKTNRDIYTRMCEGWGYRCEAASHAGEGLRLLEEAFSADDAFQLVILDQQMAGVNGLDLASLIRSRPDLKQLKLLLLSSSLNRSESERAETLGIARALSKPVKRAILLEVILETFGVGALEAVTEPEPKQPSPPKADTLKLRVLVAEDNAVNQNIAKRRLKKLGHDVVVVVNGHDAIEQVTQREFDCILMDIQMPGLDGYEATREIRRIESKDGLKRNFIVAMTAHAMQGDAEKCLANDMDDYVSKPFRAEQLKEALDKAVERKVTHAHLEQHGAFMPSKTLHEYYQSLEEADREDLIAAAQVMRRSVPQNIVKLEYAIREKNIELIKFMAHTLKGVAGIFSDRNAFRLGGEIEIACSEGALGKAEPICREFIRDLDQMIEDVEILLKSTGESEED